MAKANHTWKVLPHDPIEKLDDRVWRVEGALEKMPLRRVMTVARKASGGLVIHNAIALDDASMKEIDGWGEVDTILVPNAFHRLDAPVFHQRYPKARVLCPAGARTKVEEVVPVSGTYEDLGADDAVSLETLEGGKGGEGAMVVRGSSGTTVVLNDVLFNMPHVPGVTGWVLKHVTKSSGGPHVSRISRWFLIGDSRALRAHLERLADLPDLVRVIVSHHQVIDREPGRVLREVAGTI